MSLPKQFYYLLFLALMTSVYAFDGTVDPSSYTAKNLTSFSKVMNEDIKNESEKDEPFAKKIAKSKSNAEKDQFKGRAPASLQLSDLSVGGEKNEKDIVDEKIELNSRQGIHTRHHEEVHQFRRQYFTGFGSTRW